MKVKQLLVVVLLPLLALSTVAARAAGMPQLTAVSVVAEGTSTTVTLHASGTFVHNEYRPGDNLLLVDMPGVSAGKLSQRERAVNAPGVKSYRVVGYSGAGGTQIARLELTLAAHPEVQIGDSKNALVIKVIAAADEAAPGTIAPEIPASAGPAEPAAASKAVETAAAPAAQAKAPPASAASMELHNTGAPVEVRTVAVVRTDGGLSVEITGNGPLTGTMMNFTQPDRVVVNVANSVPSPRAHSIRVGQGDIRGVRISRFQAKPPITRVVVDLTSPGDFQLIETGGKLTLSPRGKPSAGAPAVEETKAQAGTDTTGAAAILAKDGTPSAMYTPAIGPVNPVPGVSQPVVPVAKAAPANAPELKLVNAAADTPVQPAQDFVVLEPQVREQVGDSADPEPAKPSASAALPATTSLTAPPAMPTVVASAVPSASAPLAATQPPSTPLATTQPPSTPSSAKPGATAPIPVQPAVNFAAEQRQASAQPVPSSGPRYTGEPISVNLKDVDLKDFFRLIHEISGLNIVLDPSVSGSLTLVLDNVPWDQALDIVLKNNGLDRQLEGNVLRIATMETLRKEAQEHRLQVEAQTLAVDKITVTRFLSYAHAKDVMPIIKRQLTARGDIINDDRTNALIITDIPSVMPQIDRLLTQLDRKTQEVEIEARVVAATRSFARDIGTQLGIGWGNAAATVGGSSAAGISPTTAGYVAPPAYAVSPAVPLATTGALTATQAGIPLFSNLAAAAPTSGLSFVNLGASYRVDAILTAAEQRGLLKILSRPRVITQNNTQAVVKQGQRVPITTLSQLGGPPTVTYIDAVLRLTVTPQITAENTIFLNVDIENTTPDFSNEIQGNPVFLTQQATTQVLVTNGGTVVIGGVMQTNNSLNVQQVPLLGSIPFLGNLFKNKSVSTSTQELIFFITPRIVQS